MHSNHLSSNRFDSTTSVNLLLISLSKTTSKFETDYSQNSNLVIDIEEHRDKPDFESSVQAGILVNHNLSCWLTNLGPAQSTGVYRLENKVHSELNHNQVAFLKDGDFIRFYDTFYRVEINPLIFSLIRIGERPAE